MNPTLANILLAAIFGVTASIMLFGALAMFFARDLFARMWANVTKPLGLALVVGYVAICAAASPTLFSLTSQVQGILPLVNGGTNQSSATISAHNWFGNNTASTTAPGYEQPACGDLSNAGAGCQMSTTAAGDLSGTLPSANVVSTHISGGTNTDLAIFNSTGNMVNYAGASTCTGSQAVQTITASGGVTCITTISGNLVDAETPGGSCPTTTLTLAHTPNPSTDLKLYKNGQRLIVGASADYTLSTSTVTLASSCAATDAFIADYRY